MRGMEKAGGGERTQQFTYDNMQQLGSDGSLILYFVEEILLDGGFVWCFERIG